MELNLNLLKDKEPSKNRSYHLPAFDFYHVQKATKENPIWLHLGAGNIFRAFLAAEQQHLLNQGIEKKGIIVAEGYDFELIDVLKAHDGLSINVTLKENGKVEKEVIASTTEYLKMSPESEDYVRLKEVVTAPSLQLISMTITEKGYSIVDKAGEITETVKHDFENGPKEPNSYLGKLTALLHERYLAGKWPLALVSLDNMSHNGEKLQKSVSRYVEEWHQRGFVETGFVDYMQDRDQVAFPWSMIDKITPRPDQSVQEMLEEDGFEHIHPVETAKHSFVAPYVNGEETQYLVMEDTFPNGRPKLEKAGIIFADRAMVNAVETMKVTTCLNPLHTALAIFGCLLGFDSIHQEMKEVDLVRLIRRLGYKEGLPVVKDPKIISPGKFIDEVIEVRLPNPFIPDTPQRIATDTSQKLAIRFGETVKAYLHAPDLDVKELKAIPLVYAGWLRYLTGIDDSNEKFAVSPDPLLKDLQPFFKGFVLGKPFLNESIKELLKDTSIFGVDLYQAGLAEKVLELFDQMNEGKGAIRQTIRQTIIE